MKMPFMDEQKVVLYVKIYKTAISDVGATDQRCPLTKQFMFCATCSKKQDAWMMQNEVVILVPVLRMQVMCRKHLLEAVEIRNHANVLKVWQIEQPK